MNKLSQKLFAIAGAITLLIGGFAAGTYAAKTEWFGFTGDSEITQATDHTDEIMTILRQVNTDKLTAEDALAELEAMNPPGLVRQIKELKAEIERMNGELAQAKALGEESAEYIAHLEAELQRANTKVTELNGKTTEAAEEAREIGGR